MDERTIDDIDLKLAKGTDSPRPVKTVYYRHRQVVRVTRSARPLRAAGIALQRLRENKYEATHCEVYNMFNGTLYSVQKRDMAGNVHTLFQSEFKPNEL